MKKEVKNLENKMLEIFNVEELEERLEMETIVTNASDKIGNTYLWAI